MNWPLIRTWRRADRMVKRYIITTVAAAYVGCTGGWIAWDLWHGLVLGWSWCK